MRGARDGMRRGESWTLAPLHWTSGPLEHWTLDHCLRSKPSGLQQDALHCRAAVGVNGKCTVVHLRNDDRLDFSGIICTNLLGD